jgi:hypothetical protein
MVSGNESKRSAGMATIVQCPKCSTRLQIPLSSKGGMCPRCRTPISVAAVSAAHAVPPKPQQTSPTPPPATKSPAPGAPPGTRATPSVKKLGFFAYSRQHFAATHWPAAFGICCGLLSIPIVSLLKPILGFRGMCFVLAGAVALSAVSGVVYAIQRIATFLRGERSVPIQARSWMARLTYGGWMFLIPMAPWVGAEYFAPPYGLLAAIAPDLRKEQSRWLRLSLPEADHQDSDTAASGDKKVPKTEGTGATQASPQPRAESENPFVVVEDAPTTKEPPKGKTPPATDKAGDEDPFQVIEKGSR